MRLTLLVASGEFVATNSLARLNVCVSAGDGHNRQSSDPLSYVRHVACPFWLGVWLNPGADTSTSHAFVPDD
jgi:hypothetical protein